MRAIAVETTDNIKTDMGIGGGDYTEFSYCLDCGQIQGRFPVPATKLQVKPKP